MMNAFRQLTAIGVIGLGLLTLCSCDKDDGLGDVWPKGKEPTVEADYHPFVKEGKVWNLSRSYDTGKTTPVSYIIKGDTLLRGQMCKKLYFRDDMAYGEGNWLYYAALREWGKKVYIMRAGETEGELLYDFGLKEGQHIRYHKKGWRNLKCTSSGYKIRTCANNLEELRSLSLVVDGSGELPNLVIRWVEGIGSIYSGLPFEPNVLSGNGLSQLETCYEDGVCIYDYTYHWKENS